MLVSLQIDGGRDVSVNPDHVVALYDETGNQSGTSFCKMLLTTGKVLTAMGSIQDTHNALNEGARHNG